MRRFILFSINSTVQIRLYFVSRPVGRSTVRIGDFILRSSGAIGALYLDSKIGCIIKYSMHGLSCKKVTVRCVSNEKKQKKKNKKKKKKQVTTQKSTVRFQTTCNEGNTT